MKTVFLDTVGLIAIWHRHDQWHAPAMTAYAAFIQQRVRLVTTLPVLLECGNALARSDFRSSLTLLRQQLEHTSGIATPTSDEYESAWRKFDVGKAGDPGIVDLLSFEVMRRIGITDAFTNDQHFKTAGFTTLF